MDDDAQDDEKPQLRMKYAVVDIGSNSAKMTVATIGQNSYTIEQLYKKPLRLLAPGKKYIQEEEMESLLGILFSFQKEILAYRCTYRVMATSALRNAKNQSDVLSRVYKHIGMQIEIISGKEEASLVCQAHQYLFDMEKGRHLIFDIGGGSVECIEVKASKAIYQESLDLGALRIKNMFSGASYTNASIKKTFHSIQQRLQNKNIPRAKKKTSVYISGGNPSAVSKINLNFHQVHYKKLHQQNVYLTELNKLLGNIQKLTPGKISKLYGIKPHRADVAIPTIVLIAAILDFIDADYYSLSKTGIREGDIIRVMKDRLS